MALKTLEFLEGDHPLLPVPSPAETLQYAFGIIVASTGPHRQQIQRLRRVPKPAEAKDSATVYMLLATDEEISSLK